MFPSPAHLELFDTICVFEGTAESYAGFEHPAWASGIPAERFWHLVHSCPAQEIPGIRGVAGRRGAGHMFATDRTMPNPWLGPPSDVSARLAADLAVSTS